MSEKDVEQRVRDAFASVHAPENLKRRTLRAIEERRAVEGRRAAEGASSAEAVDLRLVAGEAPSATRSSRRVLTLRAKVALAACLLVAVLGAGLLGAAFSLPTAYVTLDVNPSLELALNRFDGVVGARGLNDDGTALLEETNVVGMSYEEAVESIELALGEAGYLAGDPVLVVTVACDDEGRYDELESVSRRCLGSAGGEVSCSHASEEEHHAAHDAGLGVGKWRVWSELVDAGSDLTAEDAAGMSVRELEDLLAELLAGQEGTATGEWGHHRGHGHD